jgi:hypothetical protein
MPEDAGVWLSLAALNLGARAGVLTSLEIDATADVPDGLFQLTPLPFDLVNRAIAIYQPGEVRHSTPMAPMRIPADSHEDLVYRLGNVRTIRVHLVYRYGRRSAWPLRRALVIVERGRWVDVSLDPFARSVLGQANGRGSARD